MDAIAEFRTLTSNYSAEYGLSSAGTMSMVIKSGTRKLQAEAFYYGRNDALDARNYFNPAPQKVAALRFNDWGFNVGGPVEFKHSDNPKTFFFYNMEWRRYIKGGLFNVNTPLASIYPDANGAGTGVVLPATGANGKPIDVVAPSNIAALAAAGGCAPGSTPAQGTPFSQNTIPDCLVSANASALLGAGIFPQPTSGWAFIGGANQPTTGKEEIVRVDHQFTDKFSVFGHFIADQAVQTYGTTQWSGDNVPSVGDTFNNPSYSYVIHATHVIRPNLLNEISFNYDGNRIHILPLGIFQAPSGFTFNRIFTGANVDNRIPEVRLEQATGIDYTSNWTPWNNTADDYQIKDDLSWTKGSHQFKIGGGWAIYKKVQDYFASTQGNFVFDGSATAPAGCSSSSANCGFDYADFILGDAVDYGENGYKGTGHWNAISPDAYFQDNWRATHRLTLNLGLRWDGIPHTYEANNRMGNFYPSLYNPSLAATFDSNNTICSGASDPGCTAASPGLGTSPNPILAGVPLYLNGIGIPGQNGVPKGLVNNHWAAFGPRLGFAYDLTGAGKTVLRGGFGIMYERIQGNDMYNAGPNIPFSLQVSLNGVEMTNPSLALNTGTAAARPINPAGITGLALDNYNLPASYQYSIGVQHSLSTRTVLSVSYVGNQGRHQNDYRQINLPPEANLGALLAANAPYQTSGLTYPGFTNINMAENEANTHYNGLQVDLNSQVGRDLTLRAMYTLSKAVDPTTAGSGGGDLGGVSNPYAGWVYDNGPSGYDRRNVAVVNFIYDIPVFRHSQSRFVRSTVGGWQVSGIVTMESGLPLNLGLSGNQGGNFVGGSNRPDLTGSISYEHAVSPTQAQVIQYINPSAFAFPALGAWGTLGHNALRGPGMDNWNISLFKSFSLSESRGSRLELRLETFNTWNHTEFSGVNTTFGNSNFGQFNSTFDPRILQLGAKIYF